MIRYLFFAALIFCSGCYNQTDVLRCDFFVFDTQCSIQICGPDASESLLKETEVYLKKIISCFEFCEESELNKLNQTGKVTEPSVFFSGCMKQTVYMQLFTEGFFDPSIKTLLDLYNFYSEKNVIPEYDVISRALSEKPGFTVKISENEISVPAGILLDLGAIAKGYAVDETAGFLKKKNLSGFLINFGGEVLASGKRGNRLWKVGIRSPDENGVILSVDYTGAVATSGSYERKISADGKTVCHILSPFTGTGENTLVSASVFHESCASADAIATALMAMGKEKAEEFCSRKKITAVMISDRNEVIRTGKTFEIH